MTNSLERTGGTRLDGVSAYVAAAPEIIGLPIPAEHRESVITNLRLIMEQSSPLLALELDPIQESAPVFRP